MGQCSATDSHVAQEVHMQGCGFERQGSDFADELVGGSPSSPVAEHLELGPRRVTMAIVRHGERKDRENPTGWLQSEMGKQYPFDPPLTPLGRTQASRVGKELAQKCDAYSLVISSPYIRCVETAVLICLELGVGLCIDQELGEIFSPHYFGDWESPGPLRRDPKEVVAFIPRSVTQVGSLEELDGQGGFLGMAPEWPERDGKLRMAARVEQLFNRAALMDGANFVLVTHGDCVAACHALALAGSCGMSRIPVVSKVPYCGYTLLERVCEVDEDDIGLIDKEAQWQVQSGNLTVGSVDDYSGSVGLDDYSGSVEEQQAMKKTAQELVERKAKKQEDACSRTNRRQSTKILMGEVYKARFRQIEDAQAAFGGSASLQSWRPTSDQSQAVV
ncbi:unnamed protein product [Polarella glacialis]|uniref:Uncharacterized protein n=1 Tax=Polarella glacialis TaxID=89957 RepID=A0A813GTI9_POLGL|nr:unnamed protein product [Polarella glacialis]CAE8644543.1 unnamed protein product [Polarella glacialis]